MKSKNLHATAYHEAGHVVANFRLNLPRFKNVSIIPNGESLGRVRMTLIQNVFKKLEAGKVSPKEERYLKNFLIGNFAGPAAEAKFRKITHFPNGYQQDMYDVVNICNYIFGSTEVIDAYLNYIIEEAKALVKSPVCWYAIDATATTLLNKKLLSYKECKKIYYASITP